MVPHVSVFVIALGSRLPDGVSAKPRLPVTEGASSAPVATPGGAVGRSTRGQRIPNRDLDVTVDALDSGFEVGRSRHRPPRPGPARGVGRRSADRARLAAGKPAVLRPPRCDLADTVDDVAHRCPRHLSSPGGCGLRRRVSGAPQVQSTVASPASAETCRLEQATTFPRSRSVTLNPYPGPLTTAVLDRKMLRSPQPSTMT
jgi:hypothetical protein